MNVQHTVATPLTAIAIRKELCTTGIAVDSTESTTTATFCSLDLGLFIAHASDIPPSRAQPCMHVFSNFQTKDVRSCNERQFV